MNLRYDPTARTVALALASMLVSSCGSGPSSARVEAECVREVRRTTEEAPEGSPVSAADAVVIRSVTEEQCAPLDGPLAAFNWFSFADRKLFEETFEPVVEILARRGHEPVMFATNVGVLEVPEGEPRFGGTFVHEAFLLPVYTSAGGFLDMLVSPEFQELAAKQQAGARRTDYFWGMQRCMVGCPFGRRRPVDYGLFVLHVFDRRSSGFDESVRTLQRSLDRAELFYAGETVAVLEVEVGGNRIQPNVRPWGNGTAVYRIQSMADAEALVRHPAFLRFRETTSDDLVVVLKPGSPAARTSRLPRLTSGESDDL